MASALKKVVGSTSASPAPLPYSRELAKSALETSGSTATSAAPSWHFVDSIKYGTKTFLLNQPLAIKFQMTSDCMWEATVSKLGIIAVGKTTCDAFEDVQEEFAVIWEAFAFESDDSLSADARELRDALQKLVKLQ
jgi:hypothetical protein